MLVEYVAVEVRKANLGQRVLEDLENGANRCRDRQWGAIEAAYAFSCTLRGWVGSSLLAMGLPHWTLRTACYEPESAVALL